MREDTRFIGLEIEYQNNPVSFKFRTVLNLLSISHKYQFDSCEQWAAHLLLKHFTALSVEDGTNVFLDDETLFKNSELEVILRLFVRVERPKLWNGPTCAALNPNLPPRFLAVWLSPRTSICAHFRDRYITTWLQAEVPSNTHFPRRMLCLPMTWLMYRHATFIGDPIPCLYIGLSVPRFGVQLNSLGHSSIVKSRTTHNAKQNGKLFGSHGVWSRSWSVFLSQAAH